MIVIRKDSLLSGNSQSFTDSTEATWPLYPQKRNEPAYGSVHSSYAVDLGHYQFDVMLPPGPRIVQVLSPEL